MFLYFDGLFQQVSDGKRYPLSPLADIGRAALQPSKENSVLLLSGKDNECHEGFTLQASTWKGS